MKKLIALFSILLIFIFAELALFFTISPTQQKEVVFSDAQNNKIDFDNFENNDETITNGLTTSFLEITKENLKELEKYSRIGTLIIKDISFDTYSILNKLQVYQLNVENVTNFDISKFDKTRLQSLSLNNTVLSKNDCLKDYTDLKYMGMHLTGLRLLLRNNVFVSRWFNLNSVLQ